MAICPHFSCVFILLGLSFIQNNYFLQKLLMCIVVSLFRSAVVRLNGVAPVVVGPGVVLLSVVFGDNSQGRIRAGKIYI